ncbi:hypothetical protein BGZ61DRAFT_542607 [Ilyonectria robusta]|uniref:uncharacterized protein n=1 Tax=Ilyonectria robusta TaxID=1079257 RepID=UPI001E8D23AB|nr:uncharacterized protein BGZ61DRAFT_542607 [Ilyonectria robusta]KAH8646449.1 hypothetical protein BGZ61DRAFT_542607 [Ilyonectria robusta]
MEDLLRLAKIPRKDLPDLRTVTQIGLRESDIPKGQALDWARRGAVFNFEAEKKGRLFELMKSSFDVWICSRLALDRLGCPMYVELAFQETPSRSLKVTALAFFNGVGLDDSVFQDGIRRLEANGIRPVYIAAEFAHPLGYFFHQLPRRPGHLKALLIAFMGCTNPIYCRGCIRSWKGTVTSNKEHILTPFANYCSDRGFISGKYSNCIWNNYSGYKWELLPQYQSTGSQKNPIKYTLLGTRTEFIDPVPIQNPDLLNHQTCPRIT